LGPALGREHLDTLLLSRAVEAGAQIWQPWSVVSLGQNGDGFTCRVVSKTKGAAGELRSRLVIAAHGSWESGGLPSQVPRRPACSSDLFGFKAHFANANLLSDLMPLLVFPGGYGGMVHTDSGRVSLSCCVRRDCLEELRGGDHWRSAAEAILRHMKASCAGVRECLDGAKLEGPWIAAARFDPASGEALDTGSF
jgi:flavin-dependent dehydrogenase